MRRKIHNPSKTEQLQAGIIENYNSQVMVNQGDTQSVILNEDLLALKMQLEITQDNVINLMSDKRALLEKIRVCNLEDEVKIRELATMGELIINIDADKKLLEENLKETKEVIYKVEQVNLLLNAKNKSLEDSLSLRFDELAHLAKLLEVSERTLLAREAEIEVATNALEKFKGTLSWKATKPARVISKHLNKTKKKSKKEEYINLIKNSGFFNSEWYEKSCPELSKLPMSPVEHYLLIGFKMGLNPSAEFNGNLYVEHYPDVAQEGVNPLIHYIIFGKSEGRFI